MHTPDFVSTIGKSFSPNAYPGLSARKWSKVIAYFLSVVFIALVIGVFVRLPSIMSAPEHLNDALEKFDAFNISLDVATKEPVMIGNMIVDTTGTYSNTTDGKVVITDRYVFIKDDALRIDKFSNILNIKKGISNLFILLLVVLAPSIIVTFYLFLAISYLLLSLIAAGIGRLIALVAQYEVRFSQLWKLAIFASTPMILLDQLSVIMPLFMIPRIVSLVLFIIGIMMIAEKKSFSVKK